MTARETLTSALHAHTCHPDGELCAWAGEDYPGDGTCADVGEVGIEDAILTVLTALVTERVAAIAADLYRNHDMPPRKDSRSYSYRNGWWDGVHHAAKVVERAALTVRGGGRG